jgi:hypothetical protein
LEMKDGEKFAWTYINVWQIVGDATLKHQQWQQ